jgi:hypothetical protein
MRRICTRDGVETIRVAYPPGDEQRVRDVIGKAVSAIGLRLS